MLLEVDSVQEAVTVFAETRWTRFGKPSIFRRIANLFSPVEVNGVLMVEHNSFDSSSLACGGAVLAAWLVDESGMNAIAPEEADPGEVVKNRWRRHLVMFHVMDDGLSAIVNDLHGPSYGAYLKFTLQKPHQKTVAVECLKILAGVGSKKSDGREKA